MNAESSLVRSGSRWGAALAFVAVLLAGGSWPADAGSTERWERSGATFRTGTFEGLALAPDGRLVVGPARKTLARPEVAVIWDVALDAAHVYAATGESAGLLVVLRDGGAEPFPIALGDRPEVMALALDHEGTLWAATGPRGVLWRVDVAARSATEVARLEAQYVWDLVVGSRGALWVATGMPGTIVRVDPADGSTDVVWTSSEPHVRCLTLAADGTLYAGTAGSGLVFAIRDGRGFVLHDSLRAETAAIALADDGALWAAFAGKPGGAEAGGTGEPPRRKEEKAGFSESVTVRARAEGEKGEGKQGKDASEVKTAGRLPAGGGAVVRIRLDSGEVEEIWSDRKTTPMALVPAGQGRMFVATAGPARVLWLAPGAGEGWLVELPETRAVSALADADGTIVLGTSDPAGLVLLGPAGPGGEPARWTSDVLDTKTPTRFGIVRAITPERAAGTLRVLVRAGNTSEPDDGWTSWIPVVGAAGPPSRGGGRADVPRARFLQVRLEADPGRSDLSVDRVEVFYRPANRAPRITEVSVQPPGVAWRPVPPSDVTSGARPVVGLPQPPESARAASRNGKKGWRPKKAFEVGARTITWSAEDPDGDPLVFRVEYCLDTGAPCGAWHPLAEDLDRTFHSFDQRALPDGVYRFRIVATDARGNALGEAANDSRVSGPVLVDNTPPTIAELSARRVAEGQLQVTFRAHDGDGRLARAEIAADPGTWRALVSDDGVIDGPVETFSVLVGAAEPEGPVLVRVVDASGNTATARVTPSGPETGR